MVNIPMQGTKQPYSSDVCRSIDEQKLVSHLRDGSSAAFELLYERYQRRLLRIAVRILRNEADAEDVVHDSLIKAYTKIQSFRGDAGIYTWLVRIVMNDSLMALRKRARRLTASLNHREPTEESWMEILPYHGQDPESLAMTSQQYDKLHEALGRLPQKYQPLFAKWLVGQTTVSELSAEFGLTLAATKSRLLRARRKLELTIRRELGATGGSDRKDFELDFLNLRSGCQHQYVRTYRTETHP